MALGAISGSMLCIASSSFQRISQCQGLNLVLLYAKQQLSPLNYLSSSLSFLFHYLGGIMVSSGDLGWAKSSMEGNFSARPEDIALLRDSSGLSNHALGTFRSAHSDT